MSYFIYYLISFIACICLITCGFVLCKKKEKCFSTFLKVASLLIATVFIVRYMWAGDAVNEIFKLQSQYFESELLNFLALILVWFSYATVLIVTLYGFYSKYLTKYIKYFAVFVSFISFVFLNFHFTAILGDASGEINMRGIVFALEIGLVFGYCLIVTILDVINSRKNKPLLVSDNESSVEKLEDKNDKPIEMGKLQICEECKCSKNDKRKKFKQIISTLALGIKTFFKKYWFDIFVVIVLIFSVMPSYMLQAIFGHVIQTATCKGFDLPHRFILYIGFILPFIVHFSLKNRDKREIRLYLMYICLGTLLSFSVTHKFASFLDPVNWPLHLCNTAMYIMPIVLLFNMKRFFYFTYFINVVGALFAMFMPNYDASANMLSQNIVNFYINHYIAFFMPILFVSLGMFEKPKFKQFVYSMLGFLGYFILVLILNAMFTGMYEVGLCSKSTDFFFINSDFIADKLGVWCERLRDYTSVVYIGGIKMVFYPLYQVLFFLVYVLIGLATWFVYEQGYEFARLSEDMKRRRQAIKLEQLALEIKANGRSLTEPVEKENENKLILRNFSKKYATSDVYAVKDANLEVCGGEIFGFLGPNGAGKSTIIKSIVGIQPITSGDIFVCGYDVKSQSVEAKKQIGFVPDHYALYENLTGREYINYIADLYNVSLEDRNERIENYINRFEIVNAFDNKMKTYSHGMKQKIAIMSALVHNPKVWILDEPLTGLDPNSIYQVKECMKEHAKNGNIVFFSSHIIDVVEKICDKIAIIKKGNILVTKAVKEIEENGDTLEKFYMDTIDQKIYEKKDDQ